MMQQSNIELLKRQAENPDAVDIEHTEGQDKVIMMVRDLGHLSGEYGEPRRR
jgi:hypothetical protein